MSNALPWIQRSGFLVLAIIYLCCPAQLGAEGVEPEPAAAVTSFTSPRLRVTPVLERFQGDAPQAALHPALSEFTARHGSDWEIRWDLTSDRPHLLQGPGIPLLPQARGLETGGDGRSGATAPMTLQQVEALARQFLVEVADLLRVDPADLVLDRRRSRVSGRRQQLWLVEFQQTHTGLPIEGARVFLRVSHGRIVQFGTAGIADVALDVTPWIAGDDALPLAALALAVASGDLVALEQPELRILPVNDNAQPWAPTPLGQGHVLAWQLRARRQDGTVFRLRLDAHSGELLEAVDLRVFGEATAQVHDPLAMTTNEVPLPRLWVENQGLRQTDAAGYFDYQGGEATAGLTGALIDVEDDCGPAHLVSWDGVLDFGGASGTDCSTPVDGGAGNTQAARDAYYHLTRGYQVLIGRFPSSPLPAPLIARTNQPDMSCEAYWNESQGTLSFGRSGQGCANSGEVPGILLHELGHGADSLLGGTAADGASGEAQADVFAFLETGDACIGRGLRPGTPCHNCDPRCTGVRELEMFTEGGTAPVARPGSLEAPDGLACDRFPCPYPGGTTFQGPLGYQAHCESQIASSAVLELSQRLATVRRQPAGHQTLEDLWYAGLPALGEPYRRVDPALLCWPEDRAVDGCGAASWYSVLLAADDDDGDLANGTPNGCLIWQAFNTHGIACGASPACFCRDGGRLADAGPDPTLCRGDLVTLGGNIGLGGPLDTYLWQPGGQTTPQIQVSPDYTTEYTLTVTNACGQTYDTVTADVMLCHGMEEDFETGGQGWTTSGLWHAVDDTPCVSPPAAAGTGAMYFGNGASCTVETGGPSTGDLISPTVLIGSEQQTLSFDFYLAEGLGPSSVGRAEVAVRVKGAAAWEPRWAVRINDVIEGGWRASPEISLEPYQGQAIRVRFRFETYDLEGEPNEYLGWLVDNVQVAGDQPPPPGNEPTVSLIEAPEEPLSQCDCVRCRFLAEDVEDGDLSELLAWSSDLDGPLGSGSRSALILSPGDHQLTGTVVDYDGRSASLSVLVKIDPGSDNCGLTRWPPAEPRLHCGDEEEDP